MRKFAATALGLSVVLLVSCFSLPAGTKAQTPAANAVRTPVLVELFTSEGCSSCPPADLLLRKLLAQQPVDGAEIIALEEHVDYWNHLGWADPYSSPAWTERQGDYAALFGNDAYTPELVVDGQKNFVGSDERQAQLEIGKAALLPKMNIAITPETPIAPGSQGFSISAAQIAGIDAGDVAEVWLAVTEDGLHSPVSRGENAGRVLQHVATLRSLRKIGVADPKAPVSFTAESAVKLDTQWNLDNLRVTVFVQEKNRKRILGAASIKLKI
jgi:hypothetical protein